MKRLVLALVFAGCTEHGQSPSSENIRVGQLECTRDIVSIQFVAEIDATLDVDQSIRATFLPDVQGIQFFRSTRWDCASWVELSGFMGCVRDFDQPATNTVTVTEFNDTETALPSSFDYTAVISITDADAIDVENVRFDSSCR